MTPQTDKKVWERSRYFHVSATTSARKWGIKTGPPMIAEHINCVPTYQAPQLFRWKGYWAEIKRELPSYSFSEEKGSHWSRKIYLTYVLMFFAAHESLIPLFTFAGYIQKT